MQDTGIAIQQWPEILEMDVAGEIFEVGQNVHNLKEGDRIIGYLHFASVVVMSTVQCNHTNITSRRLLGFTAKNPRHGAFQLCSVCRAITTAKIPENISFAEGCVVPSAFDTALIGLCAHLGQGLGLPPPSLNSTPCIKTIVVWGASSSIGSMATQLASAAGIKVVGVASNYNFDFCKKCGASEVVDYKTPLVVSDVIQAIKSTGRELAGIFDCISIPEKSLNYCIFILQHFGGGTIVNVLPGTNPPVPWNVNLVSLFGMGSFTHPFWQRFVPQALERGVLKCLPEPLIVGEGLESLQNALDVARNGVSARKVVVTI